jgi:hypothetical protein
LTDTFGSLIGLDIIKESIKKRIRVPDNMILIYPISQLKVDEEAIYSFEHESETHTLGIEDTTKYDTDHRLNFYKSENGIFAHFPNCIIISPCNSPGKENSDKLYGYLKKNGVKVELQNCIYYSKNCLQFPSLYDKSSKNAVDFSLGYLIKSMTLTNRRSAVSLSTRSSN